jgi:protein TonB
MHQTLDDIVFKNRNKEYGSYRLRKKYFSGLLIGFAVSVTFITLLTLGCFWYLNSGGDSSVYFMGLPSSARKSTAGSLLSPAELAAYLKRLPAEEVTTTKPISPKQVNALRDFKVTEHPVPDTFKQLPPTDASDEEKQKNISGMGTENDSTIFGGVLSGEGAGEGMGNLLDKFPEFPGGPDAVRRYIEKTVVYPVPAIRKRINGVVIISFDVNKLGDVDNIQVEKGVNPMLDEEAVKAVKTMPKWKPGIRHGRPVIVKFIIPVRFMPVG